MIKPPTPAPPPVYKCYYPPLSVYQGYGPPPL